MPLLIEYIDAIARKKQRDVLFVEFGSTPGAGNMLVDEDEDEDEKEDAFAQVAWQEMPVRQQIIDWLDANGYPWSCCGHVASESLMMSYQGQIYIDVPYDIHLAEYQKLEAYFQNPDESMRFPGVFFCYCPLELAMENAHHDEPGFWEKWAEGF